MSKKNSMYLCGFLRGSHGRKFSHLNFSLVSTAATDDSDAVPVVSMYGYIKLMLKL